MCTVVSERDDPKKRVVDGSDRVFFTCEDEEDKLSMLIVVAGLEPDLESFVRRDVFL